MADNADFASGLIGSLRDLWSRGLCAGVVEYAFLSVT